MSTAYRLALVVAERETGLARSGFPAICPWTFDAVVDAEFWPD